MVEEANTMLVIKSYFCIANLLELFTNWFTQTNIFLEAYTAIIYNFSEDITKEDRMDIGVVFHHYGMEYSKIIVFLVIAMLLCTLILWISYFLSCSTIKDKEKLSEYECGFEPFDNATRHPFDVHFYIVGILFLIFDVEIALLFP